MAEEPKQIPPEYYDNDLVDRDADPHPERRYDEEFRQWWDNLIKEHGGTPPA